MRFTETPAAGHAYSSRYALGERRILAAARSFAVGPDGRVSIKRAITCEETRQVRYLRGRRSVVGCSRTHPPYGTSPLAVPLTCQKGEMHTLRRRVCDMLHFEFGVVPARGRQRGPYTVGGEGVRPPYGHVPVSVGAAATLLGFCASIWWLLFARKVSPFPLRISRGSGR